MGKERRTSRLIEDEAGIELVETDMVVDENGAVKKETTSRSRVAVSKQIMSLTYSFRRKLNNEVYRTPTTLHEWGDVQDSAETAWADLFFDLIYVAIAFRTGGQLDESISDGDYIGIYVFLVSFVLLFDSWYWKQIYYSRFTSRDIVHKLVDIVEGISVAFSALSLGSVAQFTQLYGFNHTLGFATSKLVNYLLYLARYAELYFLSDHEGARRIGELSLQTQLTGFPFYVAACYTAYERDYYVTSYLLVVGIALQRVTWAVYAFCFRQRMIRKNGVPIHVEFMAKRTGEFLMLMLGEGVIQIIILPIAEDHIQSHLVAFSLCFLILSVTQLVNYSLLPFDPNDHALRRSSRATMIWMNLLPFFHAGLIGVGVGLKLVLKYQYKLNDASDNYVRYAWLLCASQTIAYTLLISFKLLHIGPLELWKNTPLFWRKPRIAFWVIRFLVPFLFLALPYFRMSGVPLLSSCLGLAILIYLTNAFDTRVADEYACHNKDRSGSMLTVGTQDLIDLNRVV